VTQVEDANTIVSTVKIEARRERISIGKWLWVRMVLD
jgi:hypothetical protein